MISNRLRLSWREVRVQVLALAALLLIGPPPPPPPTLTAQAVPGGVLLSWASTVGVDTVLVERLRDDGQGWQLLDSRRLLPARYLDQAARPGDAWRVVEYGTAGGVYVATTPAVRAWWMGLNIVKKREGAHDGTRKVYARSHREHALWRDRDANTCLYAGLRQERSRSRE